MVSRDDSEDMMLRYPAVFEPDAEAGGFVVTFPDFSFGVTQGEDLDEAMEMASDLLKILVSDCIERKADLPRPGKLRGTNIRPVCLTALQDAKVALYKAVRSSDIGMAELARRLGVPRSKIDRLFNLDHASRLDQIEAALGAVGKRLVIDVRDAA